jgi:spore maturation protein SpmB
MLCLLLLLRPFSSAGSRGFLIDSMNTFGADSLTGRLSSIFSSAESTFYVIAVYFGSVNIKTPVTL